MRKEERDARPEVDVLPKAKPDLAAVAHDPISPLQPLVVVRSTLHGRRCAVYDTFLAETSKRTSAERQLCMSLIEHEQQ